MGNRQRIYLLDDEEQKVHDAFSRTFFWTIGLEVDPPTNEDLTLACHDLVDEHYGGGGISDYHFCIYASDPHLIFT